MHERIDRELDLLRSQYPEVDYCVSDGMHWFQIHEYRWPPPWKPGATRVVFSVTNGHPGAPPYGFFVPTDLKHNGSAPSTNNPPNPPPFDGSWLFLSWQPEHWKPKADVRIGDNLWGWARGFAQRLREGP